MEFLGTLIGHGKLVTRKGTTRSGLGFIGECKEGKVEIKLANVNDETKITITISTNDNKSKMIVGSFTDFTNEIHKNS